MAYDPSFAYEVATIVEHGIHDMYGPDGGHDHVYYITVYNENYIMPPLPEGVNVASLKYQIVKGAYKFADFKANVDNSRIVSSSTPLEHRRKASVLFSGSIWQAATAAAQTLSERFNIDVSVYSITSYKSLRQEALEVERYNRLHPTEQPRTPYVTELLQGEGPIVAVSDFMKLVPDQISRFVDRPFVALGTDGFGRSDTRETLRRFFEIDEGHVVVAVLEHLMRNGEAKPEEVQDAIDLYKITYERNDPTVKP